MRIILTRNGSEDLLKLLYEECDFGGNSFAGFVDSPRSGSKINGQDLAARAVNEASSEAPQETFEESIEKYLRDVFGKVNITENPVAEAFKDQTFNHPDKFTLISPKGWDEKVVHHPSGKYITDEDPAAKPFKEQILNHLDKLAFYQKGWNEKAVHYPSGKYITGEDPAAKIFRERILNHLSTLKEVARTIPDCNIIQDNVAACNKACGWAFGDQGNFGHLATFDSTYLEGLKEAVPTILVEACKVACEGAFGDQGNLGHLATFDSTYQEEVVLTLSDTGKNVLTSATLASISQEQAVPIHPGSEIIFVPIIEVLNEVFNEVYKEAFKHQNLLRPVDDIAWHGHLVQPEYLEVAA